MIGMEAQRFLARKSLNAGLKHINLKTQIAGETLVARAA